MSYHIYTTKGIILSERDWRDSDRIYSILTRDLGLIRATAIGVRKEASKLRGSLEPFTLSLISLVRGQEYWRITSAQVIKKFNNTLAVAQPLYLLERLVQGEQAHPELFDVVEEALESPDEIVLVSKILYHLGYLKESDLTLDKKALIKAINEGLEHSHLT